MLSTPRNICTPPGGAPADPPSWNWVIGQVARLSRLNGFFGVAPPGGAAHGFAWGDTAVDWTTQVQDVQHAFNLPHDHIAIELESDFSSDESELPEIDLSGNSAAPSSSARAHPTTSTGTTRTAAGPSQDEQKTNVDDLALAVASAERETESRLEKLE